MATEAFISESKRPFENDCRKNLNLNLMSMVNVKTKSYESTAIIIVALAVIFTVISYAQSIVNPFLMALFTVIILLQPIRWLVKRKVPQWLAVLIMILVLLIIYLAFFQLLVTSMSLFVENSPKYEENFEKLVQTTLGFLSQMGLDISSFGDFSALQNPNIMHFTALVVNELGEILSKEFIFLLLTTFLLTELKSIRIKAKALVKGTTVSRDYLRSIGDNIRHYLSIKTVTSLLTGAMIAIALAIIGVDYPILWGLIAFLLNYIPNIGSVIAAIPTVTFALIQMGYDGALWTAVVFIVVNIVIGNVVEPKMMGRGMGLSTFVVFFALIFWGFILGPIGMFLSVPLTMFIKFMVARNPDTKWLAIILGTGEEAMAKLEEGMDNADHGPELTK
jgi:AI-2 transport protein TqsA